MSNLRSLTNTLSITKTTSVVPIELLVSNTTATFQNGGCCCQLIIPAGKTWVNFEIWGGGGSGVGTCCCMQGPGGNSGAYSTITVCSPTLAGCSYTICAGGTSCSTSASTACAGYSSWVTGYGLSNFCANGGTGGQVSRCYAWCACYTCYIGCAYGAAAYGGTVNISGSTGGEFTGIGNGAGCYQYGQQTIALAPKTASGPMFGPGGCTNGTQMNGACTGCFTSPYFPGGGGISSQSYSGSCWCSGWGAPGLVIATYGS